MERREGDTRWSVQSWNFGRGRDWLLMAAGILSGIGTIKVAYFLIDAFGVRDPSLEWLIGVPLAILGNAVIINLFHVHAALEDTERRL
jgi:predicted tellurium resistance membrane protein TerC